MPDDTPVFPDANVTNILVTLGSHSEKLSTHDRLLDKHESQIAALERTGIETQRHLDKQDQEAKAREDRQADKLEALMIRIDQDAKEREKAEQDKQQHLRDLATKQDKATQTLSQFLVPIFAGTVMLLITTSLNHTPADRNPIINTVTPIALGLVALLAVAYALSWVRSRRPPSY